MLRRVLLALGLVLGSGSGASAQGLHTYEISGFGQTCEIMLSSDFAGFGRYVALEGAICDQDMRGLTSWTRTGDDIMLYDEDGVEQLMIFPSGGGYQGMIVQSDGLLVQVRYLGLMHPNGAGVGGQTTFARPSTSSEVSTCKVYYDSQICADASDIGEPTSGALQTLANMNVRFLGSRSSSIVGQLPAGSCVAVDFCRGSAFDDDLWCQISGPNQLRGYILKEDANAVYSQDGCG